jgi:hypothetical protein
MSQNVTLPAKISAAQSLEVETLASGSTVTEAAERAGVARETVSRWVHGDPGFIAELQNRRSTFQGHATQGWSTLLAAGSLTALIGTGIPAVMQSM